MPISHNFPHTPPERNVLVINPESTRSKDVLNGVIRPLEQDGIQFETWATKSPRAEDNIADIAENIRAGDRVIVASGDGVLHQTANAILQSKLAGVTIGALAYGGFNDTAATFTGNNKNPSKLFADIAPVTDVYALEVFLNDAFYRYAILYETKGWTATVAAMMADPDMRASMQNSRFKLPKALLATTQEYFKNRRHVALPEFTRDGRPDEDHSGVTDVLAINGTHVAQIIRGGREYYMGDTFLQTDLDVSKLYKNVKFLGKSALNLITRTHITLPGNEVTSDTLRFNDATITWQLDGEVETVNSVTSTRVTKSTAPLHFVTTK